MIPALGILGATLAASLLGSLHCAGMCGGLVAFAVGAAPRRRLLSPQLAYHGARAACYLLLGACSGALGAALDLGGASLGLGRLAALLAGLAMLGLGVAALLRARGSIPGAASSATGPLSRLFQRGHAAAGRCGPLQRALLVGALSGLIPCGWLYAFVLVAAGMGSARGGAAVMAAFWLGTLPALLAVGVASQLLAGSLRRRLPVLTALLLMAMGLLALAGRTPLHSGLPAGADPSGDCHVEP